MDSEPYNKSIEYDNIQFAIYHQLSKQDNIPPSFNIFYPIMVQKFMENYKHILAFVEQNKHVNEVATVSIYRMKTYINYGILHNKLNELHKDLSSNSVLK